jgi:hypothetical protein
MSDPDAKLGSSRKRKKRVRLCIWLEQFSSAQRPGRQRPKRKLLTAGRVEFSEAEFNGVSAPPSYL